MTGFDHTDWTHTNFAPYEPDTDGTEIQVEPLSFEAMTFDGSSFDGTAFAADPTFTIGTDVGAGAGDGLEALSVWSTSIGGATDDDALGDPTKS
jgi:hypothetical protein